MALHNPNTLPAIDVVPLFPELNKQLITLLKSLKNDEWHAPTVLPGRTIKDLASHILDGSLRRLSDCRDHYQVTMPSINSNEELIQYVQSINKTWIEETQRLSPNILILLLEQSEQWLYEYFKTLDPDAKACYAVSWAGESESQNWFDIAREYTEKWHHQMQIRMAVNKPGINSKEFFYPAIDAFMRGLPYVYINTEAVVDCGIEVQIKGNGGGSWFLEKTPHQWLLVTKLKKEPETTIELTDDIAWRLFMDSMPKEAAAQLIGISGNKKLGEVILNMRTVLR